MIYINLIQQKKITEMRNNNRKMKQNNSEAVTLSTLKEAGDVGIYHRCHLIALP